MRVFSVHEVAFERLYYGIYIPLRSVVVFEQVFDARPTRLTVELAGSALIKKFTMLLTNILLVLLAVFDFHRLPLVRLGDCQTPRAVQIFALVTQYTTQFIKRNVRYSLWSAMGFLSMIGNGRAV